MDTNKHEEATCDCCGENAFDMETFGFRIFLGADGHYRVSQELGGEVQQLMLSRQDLETLVSCIDEAIMLDFENRVANLMVKT